VGSHSLRPSPRINPDLEVPHPLATSPGELFAGVIGVVFVKLIADELVRDATQARELVAQVGLTLTSETDAGSDLVLSAIACELEARVPGASEERLQAIAKSALVRCLKGFAMQSDLLSVTVTVSLLDGRD
jgi:organic hydroperoxide reductase OsmC/OhrA